MHKKYDINQKNMEIQIPYTFQIKLSHVFKMPLFTYNPRLNLWP